MNRPSLEAPTEALELHRRLVEMVGSRRSDGNYEVQGHLTDRKGHPLTPPGRADTIEAGQALHEMRVCLVFTSQYEVVDVRASTDASPYPSVCPGAAATLAVLKGERIEQGWSKLVKGKLGGVNSCAHLVDLLIAMGSVAFQTTAQERLAEQAAMPEDRRPSKIDSCFAFASHRPVVQAVWPRYFTGSIDSPPRS